MAIATLMSRPKDILRFYTLMNQLAVQQGGPRPLVDLALHKPLPSRGVYFFYENGEMRTDSGPGGRIVRIGTHALKAGASSTLGGRLGQHLGTRSGSGNHRGSIFRLLIGEALIRAELAPACPSWGIGGSLSAAVAKMNVNRTALAAAEASVEQAVSKYIGKMTYLYLDVSDAPGPNSRRGLIERNAIALLSNHDRSPIDQATASWLGHHSGRPLVRASGLWNQRHVDEMHASAFLDLLKALISK